MLEIKGTIDYSITKGEGDKFEISYSQSLDNDIAVLAMAQYVNSIFEQHFKQLKSSAEGKRLKAFNEMLLKVNKSRIGLTSLLSYSMASREQWVAAKAEAAAKKEAEEKADTEVKEAPAEQA